MINQLADQLSDPDGDACFFVTPFDSQIQEFRELLMTRGLSLFEVDKLKSILTKEELFESLKESLKLGWNCNYQYDTLIDKLGDLSLWDDGDSIAESGYVLLFRDLTELKQHDSQAYATWLKIIPYIAQRFLLVDNGLFRVVIFEN